MQNLEIIRTARLVVFNDEDKLLLFKRPLTSKSRPGDWDFAGGKVAPHEEPAQAAVREFAEETGAGVPINDIEFLYGTTERDGQQWFSRSYFVYAGRMAASRILTLTEHDSILLAPRHIAIGATSFVPHQQAISCL